MDPIDGSQNEEQTSLVSHAVKWGAITGSIGIILIIIWYVVDYTLLAELKILALSVIIYVALLIYTGISYRNEVGGFLSYGKAFQYTMVVIIVSVLLTTVFNILLYQVVNPELGGMVTEAMLQNQEEMMRSMGAPESSIDQELAKARERAENQYTFGGQLLGAVFLIIGATILNLITSLIVRKNQPLEM